MRFEQGTILDVRVEDENGVYQDAKVMVEGELPLDPTVGQYEDGWYVSRYAPNEDAPSVDYFLSAAGVLWTICDDADKPSLVVGEYPPLIMEADKGQQQIDAALAKRFRE